MTKWPKIYYGKLNQSNVMEFDLCRILNEKIFCSPLITKSHCNFLLLMVINTLVHSNKFKTTVFVTSNLSLSLFCTMR